jgi:hypothetical protein
MPRPLPLRSGFLLLVALALTAPACDTTGEIEPLFGPLYVSLAPGSAPAILLESAIGIPCSPDVAFETRAQPTRVTISVLGTEPTSPPCTTQDPSTATVPFSPGGASPFAVEVVYGGQSDEYAYSVRSGVARLDSVRTTTTRPGPRP